MFGLQHGCVPATLNYEEPDPDCPLAVTTGDTAADDSAYVLKVSFTQMGQCAALVRRKLDVVSGQLSVTMPQ